MLASGYKGVAIILWQSMPAGKSHLKHFHKKGVIYRTKKFQING